MASLNYTSAFYDMTKGNVVVGTDTIKCMLVTSSYVANKDHTKRSDITNEVTGTGYSTGGTAATCTINAVDTANDKLTVTLGAVSWSSSTITAAAAVYYKARGGASSADELLAYIDFGGNVTSTNGTFSLTASTMTIQN